MLRNMSREEHFAGGQTSPSTSSGRGEVASLRHGNQDSSWISSISRPALSFLQKYLPGRTQTPVRSDNLSGWVSGDFKQNLVDGESVFFGQLDDMPATQHLSRHHLAYLHCQHGAAVGLGASASAGTLSWLTADSLRELGIENPAEMDLNIRQQTPVGYLATARSFLNHVLLNSASAQEIRTTEQMRDGWPSDAVTARAKTSSGNWWAGFWGTEEHRAQGWLSNLSWSKEETGLHSGIHCPPRESGTKATVAKPTELFVRCSDEESMDSESPGPSSHKEEAADNYSLLTTRPEPLLSAQELPFHCRSCVTIDSHHVSGVVAVTACSEVAVLTPDQDNGYSSLEEEHSASRLIVLKPPCEDPQGPAETQEDPTTPGCSGEGEPEREASEKEEEEGETTTTGAMEEEEEEEMDESDLSDLTDSEEEEETSPGSPPLAAAPRCQNRAIAYIMGGPCSDDSQSDEQLSEDEDDAGFDSEGSSQWSDSDSEEEEEEEDDESEEDRVDAETERLWNSLCQSQDPYNPQNFTATLHSSSARPRPVPVPVPTTSSLHLHAAASSPPSLQPSPPSLLSSSSPSPLLCDSSNDDWSASEVDEAESVRLWNSFAASSDPYSPLNFQAPLWTQEPHGGKKKKAARTPPGPRSPPRHQGASSPRYRREDAEERLDSGFSENVSMTTTTTTTTISCVTVKKVCFREEVEEFYASGDEEEDRRGPWEELARDRCRFRRRVQEVEETLGRVLTPSFRLGVYQRVHRHHS